MAALEDITLPSGHFLYAAKRDGNGLFLFLIDGTVTVQNETLAARDSIGVTDEESITLSASESTYAVLLDVPMS